MQEFIIDETASSQRLDRYIKKLLPDIPVNLINKSIRKKNITVNNKKQKNKYLLNNNDVVQIYFSEDTIEKFRGKQEKPIKEIPDSYLSLIENPIYEDEDFIVINKPVDLLSQPDKSGKVSVSELIKKIGLKNGTFSPAPINRLDRNTTGVVIIPKNYESQKKASELIRNHDSQKEYLTLVSGDVPGSGRLENGFIKDEEVNKVSLTKGNDLILEYTPICSFNDLTLLLVNLKTGKSHQIRAQLANVGMPIVGDNKYGDTELNRQFKKKYDLDSQLLHAFSYKLGNPPILEVSAGLPEKFKEILKEELGLPDGFLEETAHLKR